MPEHYESASPRGRLYFACILQAGHPKFCVALSGRQAAQRRSFLPALQPDIGARPRFPTVSIVLRIVFPLLPIVHAQAAFLSPAQGLVL
jgi:hypothetical protein